MLCIALLNARKIQIRELMDLISTAANAESFPTPECFYKKIHPLEFPGNQLTENVGKQRSGGNKSVETLTAKVKG